MTPELTALTLVALWQVVQLGIYSVIAQKQVGSNYAASPRDEGRQLTGRAGRMQRCVANTFEALILFAIAALVTVYSDQTGQISVLCSAAFVLARVLYLPAYLYGWTPGRSLIWFVGFIATVVMLVGALL